jgi:adenine-specific DNA-methyltransferase
VGNILVPKLNDIPLDKIKKILKQVDQIVRNDDSIENALNIVDEEILIKDLGIQKELCNDARGIWKKLQSRRLKRG